MENCFLSDNTKAGEKILNLTRKDTGKKFCVIPEIDKFGVSMTILMKKVFFNYIFGLVLG